MIKEKARKQRRTVKGTVLFTVVCVMMVLIVFLMGTLALAATANRRANYKYQRAQNETIARTVIDAVVTDIKNDTSSDGLNNALANKTSFDMQVELDGRQYPVAVSRGGKQCWYDATLGWVEGDIINLTATVASQSGNEPVHYNASVVMAIQQQQQQNQVNPNPAGGAFVSMGGVSPKIGTKGITTGGTEVNLGGDPLNTTIHLGHSNSTIIESPIYLNGSAVMDTTLTCYYPSMNIYGSEKGSAYMAVVGDFEITNAMNFTFGNNTKWASAADKKTDSSKDATYHYNIPCIYVGGTASVKAQSIQFGDADNLVNLYCGALDTTDKGVKVNGDIYCFDAAKTSYICGTQGLYLYKWAEKTIHYTNGEVTQTFGNLYSKGDVYIGCKEEGGTLKCNTDNINIQGDIRVSKNIKMGARNNDIVVGGDVVCGGTFTFPDDQHKTLKCKNFYADTLELNGWKIECSGNFYVKTITGSGEIKCVNYEINSNASATLTSTGAAADNKTSGTVKTYANIYPADFEQTAIKSNIITIPNAADYSDKSSFPTTLDDIHALQSIKDSNGNSTLVTYTVVDDGDALQYTDPINGQTVKTHTIEYNAKLSGTIKNEVTVKPKTGNSIVVVLDGVELETKGSNRGNLIIDDGCTALLFVNDGKSLKLSGGHLITSYWKTKIASGYNFTIKRTDPADYPKVYLYGGSGSSTTVANGNLMTVNVRAPLMTFTGAKGIENTNITYIDADSTTMDCLGLIGQLIANDINVDNEWGLAYVEPGNNGGGGNGGGNQGNNGNNQTINYSANGGTINYTIY